MESSDQLEKFYDVLFSLSAKNILHEFCLLYWNWTRGPVFKSLLIHETLLGIHGWANEWLPQEMNKLPQPSTDPKVSLKK